MGDLVAELTAEAGRRFVRWDQALWERLLAGPARDLAQALRAAHVPEAHAQRVLESYLRLAWEGIGLGYLFPPEVGESVFGFAFLELLPGSLARLPPERQLQALADCWNLGENLERAPVFLRRIFLRSLAGQRDLAGLKARVERIARDAVAEPKKKLGPWPRIVWIDLGEDDRRFLPGGLHFAAPTVICVHDRLRTGEAGAAPATLGVWLVEEPLRLGPMGCSEAVEPSSDRLDLVEDLDRRDERAADVLNSAANDWCAGLTLETSQFLVGLLPS